MCVDGGWDRFISRSLTHAARHEKSGQHELDRPASGEWKRTTGAAAIPRPLQLTTVRTTYSITPGHGPSLHPGAGAGERFERFERFERLHLPTHAKCAGRRDARAAAAPTIGSYLAFKCCRHGLVGFIFVVIPQSCPLKELFTFLKS